MSYDPDATVPLTEKQAEGIRRLAEEAGGGAWEEEREDGRKEVRVYLPAETYES